MSISEWAAVAKSHATSKENPLVSYAARKEGGAIVIRKCGDVMCMEKDYQGKSLRGGWLEWVYYTVDAGRVEC